MPNGEFAYGSKCNGRQYITNGKQALIDKTILKVNNISCSRKFDLKIIVFW